MEAMWIIPGGCQICSVDETKHYALLEKGKNQKKRKDKRKIAMLLSVHILSITHSPVFPAHGYV